MMDDDSESFELELQAMHSIYGEDVRLTRNADSDSVTEVTILVRPATGEDVEKQYLSIEVVFAIPQNYPNEVPSVTFRNPRGVSEDEISRLFLTLDGIAMGLIGCEMLLPLTDAVKDCLTAHNVKPHGQCSICLEDFAAEEGITRTLCCHCFHSHCLADYIAHAIKEQSLPSPTSASSGPRRNNTGNIPQPSAASLASENVFPCPVCRETMQPLKVNHLRKQPAPIDRPHPQLDIHCEAMLLQQREIFNQMNILREKKAREAREAAEAAVKADAEKLAESQRALVSGEVSLSAAKAEEKSASNQFVSSTGSTQPVVNEPTKGGKNHQTSGAREIDQKVKSFHSNREGYGRGNRRQNNQQHHQRYDRSGYSRPSHEAYQTQPMTNPRSYDEKKPPDDSNTVNAPHLNNRPPGFGLPPNPGEGDAKLDRRQGANYRDTYQNRPGKCFEESGNQQNTDEPYADDGRRRFNQRQGYYHNSDRSDQYHSRQHDGQHQQEGNSRQDNRQNGSSAHRTGYHAEGGSSVTSDSSNFRQGRSSYQNDCSKSSEANYRYQHSEPGHSSASNSQRGSQRRRPNKNRSGGYSTKANNDDEEDFVLSIAEGTDSQRYNLSTDKRPLRLQQGGHRSSNEEKKEVTDNTGATVPVKSSYQGSAHPDLNNNSSDVVDSSESRQSHHLNQQQHEPGYQRRSDNYYRQKQYSAR